MSRKKWRMGVDIKNFSVRLLEDSYSHYLSVDSRDKKEYVFNRKTGLLTRAYNGAWESRAVECPSLERAREVLKKDVKINLGRHRFETPRFEPGKVMRDNGFLFDFLNRVNLEEWKVTFRGESTNRVIIDREYRDHKTRFNHFSILVKFRLKNHRDYIEVGEGDTENKKFNQSGLASRIEAIIRNHAHEGTGKVVPDGKIPLVLPGGDGGILLHEILGHSLEADYIYREMSPISIQHLGRKIVSENITLLCRDGNDPFFRGVACDDEGEVPGSPLLIEKGILRNVISDFFYQGLLGTDHCGHSRLENFTRAPTPRMYAIYLEPGEYRPEECLRSTHYGVYAREFGEGKVLFNKNRFFFHIKEAYLIEKGRLTSPLGSIMVSGDIMEALNSIDMVADDFSYDKGISYCFKDGQTLHVRVGQPTIKIDNLYVSRGDGD